MKGAELLVATARANGIEVCFANPGTTEIPIVLALDAQPGIRLILGLFEGVCTGAADGYGRMLGRPAMTLLHLGPGFANGIAYLHNARRARIPLVNIIGEHATWHRPADPPLAMEIEPLAGTVSGWYRTTESADSISGDLTDGIMVSRYGLISSLIVPHDYQLADSAAPVAEVPRFAFDPADHDDIEECIGLLKGQNKVALFLGGSALRKPGLLAAARIKAATGCALITESFPSCMERGAGLPPVERLPYFPEPARELMSPYRTIILAGAREPVTFFGYPGVDSRILTREQQVLNLCHGRQDPAGALEILAGALGGPRHSGHTENLYAETSTYAVPGGRLTPDKACMTVAALQPENAIIIDEGLTTSFGYYPLSRGAPPHTFTTITGGAIGYGMPCAIGAAIACPDRPVINLQADGSGMYTVQALWTMARESLNITTLICNNRSYNIIKLELERAGVSEPGPAARSSMELDHPPIQWATVARGLGVPGVVVDTTEDLARELKRALAEPGPHLIEMLL